LDYTILRYPNVYGPRQDPYGEAGVVAIFTGQMLRNQQVRILNGSGNKFEIFVYVADCARANLLALNQGSGQVFNLGFGIGTTINQIFEQLKENNEIPSESNIWASKKAGETFRIFLDAKSRQAGIGMGTKN